MKLGFDSAGAVANIRAMSDAPATAALLIIGNEILSGRTQDANLQFLGTELNKLGIRLMEARVVSDIPEAIVEAVNTLRARYTYLFTTGGIGPTHDDITSECIAKAFGRPHGFHPEAVAILDARYPNPDDRTEARYRMAKTPEGASLIYNPVSGAPGFITENVFTMAGIPRVMQAMFDGIKHTLAGGKPMVSRTVSSLVPEGRAGGPLGELQARHPDTEIGSYPFSRNGQHGAAIVVRAEDPARADAVVREVFDLLTSLGGSPIMEQSAD